MLAQVKAWGNSQGIRLSKDILDATGTLASLVVYEQG